MKKKMVDSNDFDDWLIVCWSRNLCSASSYCVWFFSLFQFRRCKKKDLNRSIVTVDRWTYSSVCDAWRGSLFVEMKNLDVFNDSVVQIRVLALYLVFVGVIAKNVSQSMSQRRLTSLNNGYKLLRSRLRSIQNTRGDNFTTTVSASLVQCTGKKCFGIFGAQSKGSVAIEGSIYTYFNFFFFKFM